MRRRRTYWVYILTNSGRTVLYTGVTGNIRRRLAQHRQLRRRTFTGRYRVTHLVFFEAYGYVYDALAREKQIKGGSRASKVALISEHNPTWRDLDDDLLLL